MKIREKLDSETTNGGEVSVETPPELNEGVDVSLIRWMLGLTPTQRLQAAQDMVNTIWMLRGGTKTN